MTNPLSEYTLMYLVNSGDYIVFTGLTSADSPYEFSETLTLPDELRAMPIKVVVILYDNNGSAMDVYTSNCFERTVKDILNVMPLRMIERKFNLTLVS